MAVCVGIVTDLQPGSIGVRRFWYDVQVCGSCRLPVRPRWFVGRDELGRTQLRLDGGDFALNQDECTRLAARHGIDLKGSQTCSRTDTLGSLARAPAHGASPRAFTEHQGIVSRTVATRKNPIQGVKGKRIWIVSAPCRAGRTGE